MEAEARQAFETMYETIYMDQVHVIPYVVQSDMYDWMIASLDGLDTEKGVMVEIKCPGPKDHELAMSGKIPKHYIPQLQHQLLVTGLDKMLYFSYRQGDSHPVLLEYSIDKSLSSKLIREEAKFLNCMLTKTPPDLMDTDHEERFDLEFLNVAIKFARVKEELEQKLAEEQALKEEIIRLSENKSCRGGRVKVSMCSRKGAIDYAKIPQLSGLDLEAYRKPATKYCSVSLC